MIDWSTCSAVEQDPERVAAPLIAALYRIGYVGAEMNVLLIGGTGFIGAHVARLLTEQGHRVAIVHRGTTTSDVPADAHHLYGSRDVLANLRLEIARFKPA